MKAIKDVPKSSQGKKKNGPVDIIVIKSPNDGKTNKELVVYDGKAKKDEKPVDAKAKKDEKPVDAKAKKDEKPVDAKVKKDEKPGDAKTKKDEKPGDTKAKKDGKDGDKGKKEESAEDEEKPPAKKERKEKSGCGTRAKPAVAQFIYTPRLWWQRIPCEYAFNHPKIRSRLERLMGSNLVRLTDRKYMLQLHERILEDYIQTMNKRIAAREEREREREKDLVLSGKIPLDQAPKAMANHPVLLINAYCEKLIAERRAKIKVPKVFIPLYLYVDDTPDPPYGLSVADGHVFRAAEDRICTPPDVHLVFTDEEDIERGYMFKVDEYEKKQKYESPLVKELAGVETVEQMYTLADEIIGPLKTIKDVLPVATTEAPAEKAA